jgi:hypothetical protein
MTEADSLWLDLTAQSQHMALDSSNLIPLKAKLLAPVRVKRPASKRMMTDCGLI